MHTEKKTNIAVENSFSMQKLMNHFKCFTLQIVGQKKHVFKWHIIQGAPSCRFHYKFVARCVVMHYKLQNFHIQSFC